MFIRNRVDLNSLKRFAKIHFFTYWVLRNRISGAPAETHPITATLSLDACDPGERSAFTPITWLLRGQQDTYTTCSHTKVVGKRTQTR